MRLHENLVKTHKIKGSTLAAGQGYLFKHSYSRGSNNWHLCDAINKQALLRKCPQFLVLETSEEKCIYPGFYVSSKNQQYHWHKGKDVTRF